MDSSIQSINPGLSAGASAIKPPKILPHDLRIDQPNDVISIGSSHEDIPTRKRTHTHTHTPPTPPLSNDE